MVRFTRQDAHKKAKLASNWRKPRGLQSKVRLKRRGYVRPVSAGYGKKDRHLVKGLEPVVVHTAAELEGLDTKKHGVIIAAKLGSKKREALLTAAKAFTVLNLDIEKKLAAITEKLAARKKEKSARMAAKEKKKKTLEEKAKKEAAKEAAAEKKTEEKKVDEAEPSDDEKKKADEAEKQKVLTKKQ